MPAGDKKGPDGMGARTGRGAGYCAGNDGPGYMNGEPAHMGRGNRFNGSAGRFGGGRRRGGGFGRGYGQGFYNGDSRDEEIARLHERIDALEGKSTSE